jgi:hypothetical protein
VLFGVEVEVALEDAGREAGRLNESEGERFVADAVAYRTPPVSRSEPI